MKRIIIEEILNILQESVWGMTINEIAKKTGRHRNTISKYMAELEKIGLVIKRKIGKYTFWLPHNIYIYHRSRVAELFIRSVLKVLRTNVLRNAYDLCEFGRAVAYTMMMDSEKTIDFRALMQRSGIIRDFLGIFIPTVIPGLKFKVNEFGMDDQSITINVVWRGKNRDEDELVRDFTRGYIMGILDFFNIKYREIKEMKCQFRKDACLCGFRILFDKPLREVFNIY